MVWLGGVVSYILQRKLGYLASGDAWLRRKNMKQKFFIAKFFSFLHCRSTNKTFAVVRLVRHGFWQFNELWTVTKAVVPVLLFGIKKISKCRRNKKSPLITHFLSFFGSIFFVIAWARIRLCSRIMFESVFILLFVFPALHLFHFTHNICIPTSLYILTTH